MGRQILFHMLPADCSTFVGFLCDRDPVVIAEKDSGIPEIKPSTAPCNAGQVLSVMNQNITPSLQRKHIPESNRGPYYRIDSALPVIELFLPQEEPWDGRPALTQGRVYASFDQPSRELRTWFEAIGRWMRKHFARTPIPTLSGYVGPAAYDWYQSGGLLLPMIRPPVTPEWRAFAALQARKGNPGQPWPTPTTEI